jgi:hypothetical protein
MDNTINPIERMILRRVAMSFIKKHYGTIAGIAGPLFIFLVPSLHAYEASHPHTTLGVIIAALVTSYNLTAPKDKSNGANS